MNVLKPLINELVKLVKKGTNLAKDELPVIASQILKFYFWASMLWLGFGLLFIVFGIFCNVEALPHTQALQESLRYDTTSDFGVWWFLGALAGYLAGAIFVVSNLIDIVKIKLAPRLFLLEYLQGFLTNSNGE